MTDREKAVYANAVWDEFCRISGRNWFMSPDEWDLVAGWMRDGIPLRIVLRGIHDVKGRGRSLRYYAGSVNEAARQWAQRIG